MIRTLILGIISIIFLGLDIPFRTGGINNSSWTLVSIKDSLGQEYDILNNYPLTFTFNFKKSRKWKNKKYDLGQIIISGKSYFVVNKPKYIVSASTDSLYKGLWEDDVRNRDEIPFKRNNSKDGHELYYLFFTLLNGKGKYQINNNSLIISIYEPRFFGFPKLTAYFTKKSTAE